MMPKAINFPYSDIRDISELPYNTVLININPSDCLMPIKLDKLSSKILTVQFDDVTDNKEYKGEIVKKKLDYDTTLKILDFINIHKGKDIWVNCQAGISRSGAICLYLNLFHNYELKKNYWMVSQPNPFVLGQLIIAKNCGRYKINDLLTPEEIHADCMEAAFGSHGQG